MAREAGQRGRAPRWWRVACAVALAAATLAWPAELAGAVDPNPPAIGALGITPGDDAGPVRWSVGYRAPTTTGHRYRPAVALFHGSECASEQFFGNSYASPTAAPLAGEGTASGEFTSDAGAFSAQGLPIDIDDATAISGPCTPFGVAPSSGRISARFYQSDPAQPWRSVPAGGWLSATSGRLRSAAPDRALGPGEPWLITGGAPVTLSVDIANPNALTIVAHAALGCRDEWLAVGPGSTRTVSCEIAPSGDFQPRYLAASTHAFDGTLLSAGDTWLRSCA